MLRKIVRGILIGALVTILGAIPVLSAYYSYIDVIESGGNAYTNLAMQVPLNTLCLVSNMYILESGLDTRVVGPDYYSVPHLLAEDRVLWVGNLTAMKTTRFTFCTGQIALESFPIITGYGGYIRIPDDSDIEPGNIYAFVVAGYVDTTRGSNKYIIRKDGAVSLRVTRNGQLTFAVSGGNSLVANGVVANYMTIMVYCDGEEMWMTINDVEVDRASASPIPDTSSAWFLFENNVMPYVYYYGAWRL